MTAVKRIDVENAKKMKSKKRRRRRKKAALSFVKCTKEKILPNLNWPEITDSCFLFTWCSLSPPFAILSVDMLSLRIRIRAFSLMCMPIISNGNSEQNENGTLLQTEFAFSCLFYRAWRNRYESINDSIAYLTHTPLCSPLCPKRGKNHLAMVYADYA